MRILVVSNLYPPYFLGGYEILCAQVCRLLATRGHEVHVITSRHGVNDKKGADPNGDGGVGVSRVLELTVPFEREYEFRPTREWKVLHRNYASTKEVIAWWKPDIVFAWSQLRLSLGSMRCVQELDLPNVWTFNDANIMGYRLRPPSRRPASAARWVITSGPLRRNTLEGIRFDWSASISRQLRNDLVEQGLPISNGRVIYQGIEIEKFPAKEEPGAISAPMRVLYTGQLHEYKGVHTLIEAARLYAEKRGADSLTVTIAGDGPQDYVNRLKKEALATGVSVRFAGRLPHAELPPLYRSHDVFVFPSIWREPFGLTHLEAMASGLPVVSTRDGGQGEFLEDGANSLAFPASAPQPLCDALLRLADNPGLAREIALNGRRTVEDRFTLERYVDGLETLLKEAWEASR